MIIRIIVYGRIVQCYGHPDTQLSFFQFHLEERWGVDKCKLVGLISQERSKVQIELVLSANTKSYIPRRLAQQRMTLSNLE